MLLTAELRLWWPSRPRMIEAWFQGDRGTQPWEERTDLYLLEPEQTEIGIKLRHAGESRGSTEIKLLVADLGTYRGHPKELWVKSASRALTLDGTRTLRVHKSRLVKTFQTDRSEATLAQERLDHGCDVELAKVRCEDERGHWWTAGFEAFGTLETVGSILNRTLEHVVPQFPGREFVEGMAGGYPKWLSRIRAAAAANAGRP